MNAKHPPLPEWITSQLQARRMCVRSCGRPAVANVRWAGTEISELLCGECWDATAEERRDRYES